MLGNFSGPTKIIKLQGGDTLGVPLDGDPFAKVEGVKMLSPSRPVSPATGLGKENLRDAEGISNGRARRPKSTVNQHHHDKEGDGVVEVSVATPSPWLPGARNPSKFAVTNSTSHVELTMTRTPPVLFAAEDQKDCLTAFLGDSSLLGILLEFLSFYEWCTVLSLSRAIRFLLVRNTALRETVLERFLRTVGYSRWVWNDSDPLSLSLQVCFSAVLLRFLHSTLLSGFTGLE